MSDDLVKRARLAQFDTGADLYGDLSDRIEELEAKLAAVIAAYRLEAMKRDDYSHDAFDKHSAELTGGKDE